MWLAYRQSTEHTFAQTTQEPVASRAGIRNGNSGWGSITRQQPNQKSADAADPAGCVCIRVYICPSVCARGGQLKTDEWSEARRRACFNSATTIIDLIQSICLRNEPSAHQWRRTPPVGADRRAISSPPGVFAEHILSSLHPSGRQQPSGERCSDTP